MKTKVIGIIGALLLVTGFAFGYIKYSNGINHSNSFYISKDGCGYCHNRLKDINKSNLKNYNYKEDSTKLISKLGYEKYESLSTKKMPILVIQKDKHKFEFKTDDKLPKGNTYKE